ncbi:MAG TPA: hypothetical protein VJ903_01795 [Clostridia bacterium]|nr:hypothetical protein [Clostridia bacterium]
MKKKTNTMQPNYAKETVNSPTPVPASPNVVLPMPNAYRTVNTAYGTMDLPAYMCTDQYGRVYQAQVFYGALPCNAPVPIPMPNQTPQVQPIVIPVDDNKRI